MPKMNLISTRVTNDEEYLHALEIRSQVFIEEQGVPADIEIDEYENIATHVVLYTEDRKPVATGRIRDYSDNCGKIERIAVIQEGRKLGYGRRIMAELEQIAKEEGYEKVILEAQLHAKEFYEKLKYVNLSPEPFYEAGILHVKMEKLVK